MLRLIQRMHVILTGVLFLVLLPINTLLYAEPVDSLSSPRASFTGLTIASSNNFPPINLLDENSQLQGFASDISNAVAKQMGVEVRHIHSSRWTEVLAWLDSGQADLIHDAGYTRERESFLDFSDPIIEMSEVIFVRESQYDVHNLDSLKGKKVACVNKHITHLHLQRIPEINCHVVNTPTEGLAALISGSVDAFVYPEQIVQYLAQDLQLSDHIKITGTPLHRLSWSMTVKKGNQQLLEQLNQGIAAIKRSGQYKQIYDKWFGRKILAGYSTKELFLFSTLGSIISILLGLMLGLAIYTRKLRRTFRHLKESEDKYHSLIDKLPQRVFLKDIELNYISCNKQYADDLGISPREIAGKNDFDFHPENAAEYQRGDREVMEADESIEFEEYYVDDGKEGVIQTTKIPMHDDTGKVNGVLGIFWDITEQKQLQEEISRMLREYTAVTDTVPDVLYKLDTVGNIVWCNKQFENITGLSKEQIIGVSALQHFPEPERNEVFEAISKVFETGFARVEAHFITQSGEVLYDFNGAKLFDDKGNVIGLTGVGRDISKEKAAEIKQEKLQQQLQQAQKMEAIGQLTGGIAHDFNNMLASILGYSELALKRETKNKNSKTAGYLQEVIDAGERASGLIRQMLTFSRGAQGEMKPLLLNEQLHDTVKMLRPILPSSIELKMEIDNDVPAIMGDAVQLQQLLTNLCINARDAMMGQGHMTLKLELQKNISVVCNSCHESVIGDFVVITVQDSGHGIPDKVLDRIFEPFVTTKAVGKGSGMGLAMVHGIVHEHGGHITVQSSVETGTLFQVFFPFPETTPLINESSATSYTPASAHQANKYHLLVVDDEPTVMEMLKELLIVQGYEVTGIADSHKALALFNEDPEQFDMIITDQTMPGITGAEMAKAMLLLQPDLPIILCTGYSEHIDEKSSEMIGIRAFLTKPLDMVRFLTLVEQHINTRS
ncbi:MAG: transporter substrate-binding domain-containing protein [Sulfuriflexus sp.]|nr:transporter substrate-binding domain-containing protein [Sulfuriflexus sp.]